MNTKEILVEINNLQGQINYKHKNEIKVIYVPHWATCNIINATEEERKNI